MGKNGPLEGSTFGHPRGRPSQKSPERLPEPVAAIPSIIPDPPEHLGPTGRAIWADLWPSLPVLSPRIDRHSVERYCEAADDAAAARLEISARGVVLDEVLGDAKGGSLGTRAALNPAVLALKNSERTMTELADRLGLSPASRARLGLTISLGALAAAEAGRVLGTMYSPVDVVDTKAKRR
jgi:P27 family predicted phage terminase small subunit